MESTALLRNQRYRKNFYVKALYENYPLIKYDFLSPDVVLTSPQQGLNFTVVKDDGEPVRYLNGQIN